MYLVLIKEGKGAELSYVKNIKDELESKTNSRTLAVKNAAVDIYKEVFLWIGEGV